MLNVYIFDLDGTIADFSHRRKYLTSPNKDYDKFYTDCMGDTPISHVITTMQLLYKAGAIILIVTGRRGEIKEDTQTWLEKYNVPYHELHMRPIGNRQLNFKVKEEMLTLILEKYSKEQIVAVFDDMSTVVEMWRTLGFEVFKITK